jgi:hypothetical protein
MLLNVSLLQDEVAVRAAALQGVVDMALVFDRAAAQVGVAGDQ